MAAANVPNLVLNDGNEIPQLGFGVFKVAPAETEQAVRFALEAGYRHIDTAQMYENEAGVGAAIKASGIDRSKIYVTTKLNNNEHLPERVHSAFQRSLEALQSDYVDLFLIHWPLPMLYDGDFVSTWRALEELKAGGQARSIGVSNFQVPHLARLAQESSVTPAVNQIELHPLLFNREVRSYNREHEIATEAWSPLAKARILTDDILVGIAGRLQQTVAQVILRWHIQHGHVVIPKSVNPERMRENIDVFGFELSQDDMRAIDGLDRGNPGRTGPHPDTFDYIPS